MFNKPLKPLENAKIEKNLRKAFLATADGYAVDTNDADDKVIEKDSADVENPAVYVINFSAANNTSGTSFDTAEPAPNWGGKRRKKKVNW